MKFEYIALSRSIRELIGAHTILKDICTNVFISVTNPIYSTYHNFGTIHQSTVH